MAEIRVEPKGRSLAWLWVLIAVIIVAAVLWYLVYSGTIRLGSDNTPPPVAASTLPSGYARAG